MMRKLDKLEKTCDRRFASARRARQRLADRAAAGHRKAVEVLQGEEALIGAFSAGIIVDQLRSPESGLKTSGRQGSADRSDGNETGSQNEAFATAGWASYLLRMALPIAIREFTVSDSRTPGDNAVTEN